MTALYAQVEGHIDSREGRALVETGSANGYSMGMNIQTIEAYKTFLSEYVACKSVSTDESYQE